MARHVSSSFTGVRIEDTDRGAPTFKRVISNVCGDAALLYDQLTGRNGETDTINHGGTAGRGALMRIQLANQYIGRSLNILDSSGGKDGGEGDTNIIAVPIFVPSGETANIIVELFMTIDQGNRDRLQGRGILATSDGSAITEIDAQALKFESFALGMTRVWTKVSASAAGLHYLFVRMTTSVEAPSSGAPYDVPVGTLHSGSVRHDTPIQSTGVGALKSTAPFSVWTPSSTQGLGHRNFDAGMFADDAANHAYLTTGADRNLNSIIEYTTGWPAGGNASYTQVDHDSGGSADSSNPARSRFHAGTQSLETSEAEFDFPLICEALGAFKHDGGLVVEVATPPAVPTYGMLDWFAPYSTDTARQTIHKTMITWPDFQTSTSRLKVAVLVGSDAAADVTDFTITLNKATGRVTLGNPFGAGTIGALDGTNRYWVATGAPTNFSPDTTEMIELEIQKTTGSFQATNQAVILGWCLYFDPT
jgi:hypothetical protein